MKIVFTGGGTAGHVMVNRVLIACLQKKDPDCRIVYIGSHTGMERSLVAAIPNLPFYSVSTGKWRRCLSAENLKDLFRLPKGVWEALRLLRREKPQLVCAGGGYVVVPVVWAAWLLGIPVLLRETDFTVGLANRLCLPFAREVFVTFPETREQIRHKPASFPGMIVRPELYGAGQAIPFPLPAGRPLCLILGGSLGSEKINQVVWEGLEALTSRYTVVHLYGRNGSGRAVPQAEGYYPIPFTDQLGAFFSAADVVVTRCGSNAIAEGLSLNRHMVCIPLARASRGEQQQNAAFAVQNGCAVLLPEKDLTPQTLLDKIQQALHKDAPCPYACSREEMIRRIQCHADHLYAQASRQMERDLLAQAGGSRRLNLQDLSEREVQLLGDAEEHMGLDL